MTVKDLNMNLNLKSSSKCNAMKQEMRDGLGKAKLASPDLLKYKKWEGETELRRQCPPVSCDTV